MTETEILKNILKNAGVDTNTLPDNLTSTLLKEVAKVVAAADEKIPETVECFDGVKALKQLRVSCQGASWTEIVNDTGDNNYIRLYGANGDMKIYPSYIEFLDAETGNPVKLDFAKLTSGETSGGALYRHEITIWDDIMRNGVRFDIYTSSSEEITSIAALAELLSPDSTVTVIPCVRIINGTDFYGAGLDIGGTSYMQVHGLWRDPDSNEVGYYTERLETYTNYTDKVTKV